MKKFRVVSIVKILISTCLIFVGILAFSGISPGSFFFLDFSSLIYVVLGGVSMTLMGFSFSEIGAAFRHALGSSRETGKWELEKSVYFWEATARNFFMMGVLMNVVNFIILLKNINSIAYLWKSLAICFVTTLYGLILAALSTINQLRVSKKIADPGLQGEEMNVEPAKQGHSWNIERVIGILVFIATIGWTIFSDDALIVFIHWPSLLIVAGGAILFVIGVGDGEDGLSTTSGFAFTGIMGILFGLVQMFYASPSIQGIAEGMTLAILSCVFAMLGMMLGGVHRQDHAFKTGKTDKKITISRLCWYGFPIVTLMLMFWLFLVILIPITKEG